jgi:hypothetical protein
MGTSSSSKGAPVNQPVRTLSVSIVFLSTLFFAAAGPNVSTTVLAAQPAYSESGISENTASDTVRVQNSSRKKNVETVHVKNSNNAGMLDTVMIQNSDEPAMRKDAGQNTVLMGDFPQTRSNNERVRHKGKIITGAALFGVSYGLSLFVAAVLSSDGSSADSRMAAPFCIPVFGPVVAEFTQTPSSDVIGPITLLCVAWSAAQGIGLTLLISGLVGSPAHPANAAAVPFSVEPLVMKDRAGLTLRMRFN